MDLKRSVQGFSSWLSCNEKNGPGKKWPARAIFFCKNWAPLAKIGPSFSMEPESDMAGVSTDGEGLEEALDDAAYEYLTTEGGERYPDGCSESRKRSLCIRKKSLLLWKMGK